MADQVSSIATSVTPISPFLLHRLPPHVPIQIGARLHAALWIANAQDSVRLGPLKDVLIQLPQVCGIPHEHLENIDIRARGLHHAGAVRQWVEAIEVAGRWVDQAHAMASFDQQLPGDVTHRRG